MESRKTRTGQAARTLLLIASLALLLAGCTNHYLTKQMLMDQLFPHWKPEGPSSSTVILPLPPLGVGMSTRYDSNRLSRILCYNQKDEKVYLGVNQNTQLIITDKKGETYKFYLDTVFLQNGTLVGLRSRILGIQRSVPLDDIDKIEVYAELSREAPAD